MITKEQINALKEQGVLEECLIVAKAYKTKVSNDEAGAVGNIHHVCATCGRGFDKYIKLKEGTAVCSYCEGSHVAEKLLLILGDEIENTYVDLGGPEIAEGLLKTAIEKAIAKLIEKAQNM